MRRIWALDLGADTTTVVVAEEKGHRDIKLLAKAESPTQGLRGGVITSVGDLVESVHGSMRGAEKMCGLKCDKLFYNYDDVSIETVRPAGTKVLVGEGQIARRDIADAENVALRTTGHFEKCVVYVNPIHYLMDGKDSVTNPMGVFGHELEVRLLVLLGRAQHAQRLQRVFQRAGFDKIQAVVTGISAAYGVLDDTSAKKRALVWDIGRDQAQAVVIHEGVVYDHAIFLTSDIVGYEVSRKLSEETRAIFHRTGFIEEVVLTGDLSEDETLISALAETVSVPLSAQIPVGSQHLSKAKYASLAGLVYFGLDKHASMPKIKPGKEVLAGIKERTTSFLNDYF